MQLYLTSYRLGEYPEKFKALLPEPREKANVALITNALDYTNNYFELTKSVQRDERDITALGLSVERLDLRDYFGKSKALKKKLQEFQAVYVRGGNVFVLHRAFYESGFDQILLELAKNPEFVYAGYSSGACILAPSLQGLEYLDDPEIDPEGYQQGVRPTLGLSLIPFQIAPHFRSDHPGSQNVNLLIEYYLNEAIIFVALKDESSIITSTQGKV